MADAAFETAATFSGARRGWYFGTGASGTGYYKDGAGKGEAAGKPAAATATPASEPIARPGHDPWHWKERDLLPFAHAWLRRNVVGSALVDRPDLRVVVSDVLLDGECLHCRRKGRDFAVVSLRVKLSFRGSARVGRGGAVIGEGGGAITFHEVGSDLADGLQALQLAVQDDEGAEGSGGGSSAVAAAAAAASQVMMEAEVKVGPEARPGAHLDGLTEEEYLTPTEVIVKRAMVDGSRPTAEADDDAAAEAAAEATAEAAKVSTASNGLSAAAQLVGGLLGAVRRRVAGATEAELEAEEEEAAAAKAADVRAQGEAARYGDELRRRALPSKFAAALSALADGAEGEPPSELALGYAMLKDSDVGDLAAALKSERAASLESLALNANEVSDAGVSILVRALAAGGAPALSRLDLRGNAAISARVGHAMLKGLKLMRKGLTVEIDEPES